MYLAPGSSAIALATNFSAASMVYSPGITTQFTTWLHPSAIFTTKYFFKRDSFCRIGQRRHNLEPVAWVKSGRLCYAVTNAENLFLVLHVNVLCVYYAFIFLFMLSGAI
jgi:hypothetical protein